MRWPEQTSLYRIVAPHFVCGIVVNGGVATEAAPIIRYMIGWKVDRMREYCAGKRWSFTIVPGEPAPRKEASSVEESEKAGRQGPDEG